jgi:1-deoxyxylulose-5-phosphate synthase
MAKEKGLTTAQMALLWCMVQPGVTSPIVGPRTMEAHGKLPAGDGHEPERRRAGLPQQFDELVHPGNAVADFHNSNPWMKAYSSPRAIFWARRKE